MELTYSDHLFRNPGPSEAPLKNPVPVILTGPSLQRKTPSNFHFIRSIGILPHKKVPLETDGSTEHRRSSFHDTAPHCCSQFAPWDQSENDSAHKQHLQEHLTCYQESKQKTSQSPHCKQFVLIFNSFVDNQQN